MPGMAPLTGHWGPKADGAVGMAAGCKDQKRLEVTVPSLGFNPHLDPVWSQANHFACRGLDFPICKMGKLRTNCSHCKETAVFVG